MNPDVKSAGPLFEEFNSQGRNKFLRTCTSSIAFIQRVNFLNSMTAVRVCVSQNLNLRIAPKLKDMLIANGLESVCTLVTPIPLGWGGRLGQVFLQDIREIFISAKPWLSKAFGIYDQDFDRCLDESVNECVTYQAYFDWHVVWGRLPDDEVFDELETSNQ